MRLPGSIDESKRTLPRVFPYAGGGTIATATKERVNLQNPRTECRMPRLAEGVHTQIVLDVSGAMTTLGEGRSIGWERRPVPRCDPQGSRPSCIE